MKQQREDWFGVRSQLAAELASLQDCKGFPGHLMGHGTSRRCAAAAGPPPSSHLAPAAFPPPRFPSFPSPRVFFHVTLLPRLFNHPAHLGTSRSPPRTSGAAAPAPSPQPQGFWGSPLLPRPHFGVGNKKKNLKKKKRKKIRGRGTSPGAGAGAGLAPGDAAVAPPSSGLRGAVANCPRKSPRSTALRRLFF